MKKDFPGYFCNDSASIEKIWEDCFFVLDANVLLSLYRYSDSTRADLLETFERLAHRLWVPHQVVYEYLTNRLAVIGEQVEIYEEAIGRVEVLKKSLEHANQHPFVSSPLLKDSNELFDRLVSELSYNKRIHEDRITQDEIKDRLENLFFEKVGPPYDRERTEKVLLAGKARYDEKIPPGFLDIKKGGDSASFSDRCKPYGDYIVWLQIMDRAKIDAKPVIFITGDLKKDWWLIARGRTIGPLPQLVSEFEEIAAASFYMYQPARFLERANEYLNQETSQQTIDEIQDFRSFAAESEILDEALNLHWPSSHGRNYAVVPEDMLSVETMRRGGYEVSGVSGRTHRSKSSLEELVREHQRLYYRRQELRERLEQRVREREALEPYVRTIRANALTTDNDDIQRLIGRYDGIQDSLSGLEAELEAIDLRLSEVEEGL